MAEHHGVMFSAEAGLFVSAERGMRRVLVAAIGSHTAGLNRASCTVGGMTVPGPDSCTETVESVIGYPHRVVVVTEVGYRDHRLEGDDIDPAEPAAQRWRTCGFIAAPAGRSQYSPDPLNQHLTEGAVCRRFVIALLST